MFDQTFVNAQAQTRKPWTVLASLSLQASLVLALLIAPLLRIAKLEAPPKVPEFLRVTNVDIKAQPDVKPATVQRTTSPRTVFQQPTVHLPMTIPPRIVTTADVPVIGVPSVAASGLSAGPLFTFPFDVPVQNPRELQKPAPPAPTVQPSKPVAVGGDVQAAKLIYSPRPAYPRLALTTRTQGTVLIRAIISRDGTIGNLQVIGGPPLLVQAALDAVRQWRYKPTTLNGETVEVLTDISVNFTLAR